MKYYQLMLAVILTAVLAGCSTTSTSINSRQTYDRSTDFSGLNSYAWSLSEEGVFPVPASTEHFKRSSDNLLAAKGFKLNPDAPDFIIKTHFIPTYVEVYQMVDGELDYPQAMLRINITAPSSDDVLYESAAHAYPDDYPSQEARNVVIDQVVKALLGDFPPDTK